MCDKSCKKPKIRSQKDFLMQIRNRNDIFFHAPDRLKYILIICIIVAIIIGMKLSTDQYISVSTDFCERLPEERVARIVKNLPEYRSHDVARIKKSCTSTGGGGDPRARVTKRGVLGIVSGEVRGSQTKASPHIFGRGGFTEGIDAILSGVRGLKQGGGGGSGRMGAAGIGYGDGYGSGYSGGGDGVDDLLGSLMGGNGTATIQKQTRSGQIMPPEFTKSNAQTAPDITYSPSSYSSSEESSFQENPFLAVADAPVSTFSIDVDKASYINVRRFVQHNMLPPAKIIRIEEMINYFSYDYPAPAGKQPFSVVTEVSACPWEPDHRLVHIGLRGRRIEAGKQPCSNFVFLIDVSGSMASSEKLPLLKESLRLLVDRLTNGDRIAIVAYAGKAGLILNATPGDQKRPVLDAIDRLQADGCTAGSDGIQLAYYIANQNFIHEGNNRIILATDGNFNVGAAGHDALVRLVEKRRGTGIFLTVLGFGVDENGEAAMEKLADNGDGNFACIDNINDARALLVDEMRGTFFIVGKDVKIQVAFEPRKVASYRLIGYENRLLKQEEFSDDTKDAGELGAEQTVTALYEIIPANPTVSMSSYAAADTLLLLRLRYKEEKGIHSKCIVSAITDNHTPLYASSDDFRFAAAVAGLGMLLRDSQYTNDLTYDAVIDLGLSGLKNDLTGKRHEFIELCQRCKELSIHTQLSSLQ